MFLHLGDNITISVKEIIGIFDLEKTTTNKETREFLSVAEEEGFIVNITEDMPKTVIVTERNKKSIIYLSPISLYTLRKRINDFDKLLNNK